MFVLPYLLAGAFGIGLMKVGTLLVWVAILVLALKLALITIVALAAMLGYSHFSKPKQ